MIINQTPVRFVGGSLDGDTHFYPVSLEEMVEPFAVSAENGDQYVEVARSTLPPDVPLARGITVQLTGVVEDAVDSPRRSRA